MALLIAARALTRLRWISSAIVVACLLAAFVAPAHAHGATAAELKSQLDRLKAETSQVGDAWDRAYHAYDDADARLAATDRRLAKTQKELVAAKGQLGERAALIYRRGSVDPVEFLLGSVSFEDLVRRMDYLRRVSAADAKSVAEVKRIKAKLVAQKADFAHDQQASKQTLASLGPRRDELDAQLRSKQAEFKRVKAALDAVRGGPNRPSGQASTPGPNGMVFPVVGSYYYSDTWGAARGGRRHQGTDIMSPRGTPVVAISSGDASSKEGGLGGKTIWLTCDNGWQAYYAHLDGWAVRSGHVRAGQIIGYVGNTGNAAGGACHLHFQLYTPSGIVNPYSYLRAME